MPRRSDTPHFHRLTIVLILIASFCELAILLGSHWKELEYFSLNAMGVLEGTPLGKAYQNRLLGPALAWALSRLFGHFEACFYVLFCAFWTTANLAMYSSVLRLTRHETRAKWAAAGMILMTLILFGQRGTVFYLWDALDGIFFTLFAYAVFTRRGWRYLTCLFLLELLNREAAVFIAAWMMLSSFSFSSDLSGRSLRLKEPAQFGMGLMLAVVGVVLVRLVRDALFRHDLIPSPTFPSSIRVVLGNYWLPFFNLQLMGGILKHPSLTGLVSVGIYPALAVFLFLQRNRITHYLAQVLALIALMLASNLCFAVATELRTWLDLVPLLIMLHFSDEGRKPAVSAPVSTRG